MPKSTGCDLLPEEPAAMLAALRRARYGYALALPMVLLYAAGQHPDGHRRRRPLLLALQRVPHGACLSAGQPRPGSTTIRSGSCPPVRTTVQAPDTATVSAGPAQGNPAGLWLVPHPLERRHVGSDGARPAADGDLRRDDAPLAARDRLGGAIQVMLIDRLRCYC